MRKPGEGVWNIVRFNWHFYALAVGVLLVVAGTAIVANEEYLPYLLVLLGLVAAPVFVSLLVSYYVYDYSGLYRLDWLPNQLPATGYLVNIHAGFDETSVLLASRFGLAQLRVFDFYDPQLHTEVSIKRARAVCPPFPGTVRVQPQALPLPPGSTDCVFVLLAAHEIRQPTQRAAFLQEVRRVLRPSGRLVVVEHLRDPANFLAYTIGFLHFYSRATWQRAFRAAGLKVTQEIKITPFLSAFILEPNGTAA